MRILNKDHYSYYKEKSKSPLSYEQYNSFLYGNGDSMYDWRTKEVCKEFGLMQDIIHTIVHSASMFPIPYGLGNIYVTKKKNRVMEFPSGKIFKKRSVNWKETKQKGSLVFHENVHTDEYIYKIKWDTSYHHYRNKTLYKFKPSRGFQRYIAFMKEKNPQLDYLEDV
jgi:hypothetical protein